jgi:hypothetical protein
MVGNFLTPPHLFLGGLLSHYRTAFALLLTFFHVLFMALDICVTDPTIAKKTSARIRPYSMAVAPRLHAANFRSLSIVPPWSKRYRSRLKLLREG